MRRAFVLSLTDWEGRSFSGGETLLFQPHMLDYWTSFDPERGMEMKDMVKTCWYRGTVQPIVLAHCTALNDAVRKRR